MSRVKIEDVVSGLSELNESLSLDIINNAIETILEYHGALRRAFDICEATITEIMGNDEKYAGMILSLLDQDELADVENNHAMADGCLCELLTSIGCDKTVAAFNSFEKHYG